MTDANISKTDLENVCQALGIATDGVKADLIQRIRRCLKGKNHADSCNTEGNGREEDEDTNTVVHDNYSDTSEIGDLNQQARTLKELAHLSRKGIELSDASTSQLEKEQSVTFENNRGEPKLNIINNRKCSLTNDKETKSKDGKLLTEFKRLKNAMLTINDKLNTVTAQVHDTKQRVKELDLAMESRSTTEVVDHINNARELAASRMFTLRVAEEYGWNIASALPDTQDDWMKGKNSLIEKAKIL
ncbi:8531_t:CDS:2 [Acaulospora morrowiae]|uniref:8531_t:CDS:1 n=1 Tax=Acaulospora morrowiae TaxID=94023 RepID=A0A9N8VIU1_9GLOM|nr:8531_t:CDS:2 [Acaulospora morrowiae]